MIGRLSEATDSENSETHLLVTKGKPSQVSTCSIQQSDDIKVVEHLEENETKEDCLTFVTVSSSSVRHGVLSNSYQVPLSDTETVSAMSTSIQENDIETEQYSYSEQESNVQEHCAYDDFTRDYMANVNPLVSVITHNVTVSADDDRTSSKTAIPTSTYHLKARSPSQDVTYHHVLPSGSSRDLQLQEVNTVSISDFVRRTCDTNVTYAKSSKSRVPKPSTISPYVRNVPCILNKQASLQTRGPTGLPVTNSARPLNKLKSNPQVYKVQNVLLKPSTSNGYMPQYAHSAHPTTSQTYSESTFAPPSRTITFDHTSGVPSFPITKSTYVERDSSYVKRNRKVVVGKQYHKDLSDQSNSPQAQVNYSNKLPNIISKVRDNLSDNVLRSVPNKTYMNPSEHARVVRKYEPKFNTMNMEQNRVIKKRPDHVLPMSRNSLSDPFTLDHHLGLPGSTLLSSQETYSRKDSRQNRTGQNNNVSSWKQATCTIGSAELSENVTPIVTSNTWDEIPRLNYSLSQEPRRYLESSSTIVKESPQVLIVRGDSQAPPQKVGGVDEELSGKEIRTERSTNLSAAYHSLQVVLQDHNYGAPPPSTSLVSPLAEAFSNNGTPVEHISGFNRQHEDDAVSIFSVESHNNLNNEEDEETETAPEEENDISDIVDDQNSVTRCICDFQHDDGYMIQCGQCLVWQHIVCVGVTPKKIPKKYLCDFCQPRELDRYRAHSLQKMIRDDLNMLTSSDSSPTRAGDKDRVNLKLTKRKGETTINFPVAYNTPRNKRIRRDSSPKAKVRRPYKERKKVFRKKVKTDMDRPSVRPWLDNYEVAVTNHYSQELRARLSGITKKQEDRPDFVLSDCTTIPFAGGRIMISTIDISPQTPVIELMGKFMLSSQHQNATAQLLGTNSRQVTQKPGPFVFFYRMPQEGADICIDTRTYGNDARFVRRSCKPNCELHHWFDKGTLHVFLKSIDKIVSNTEITLRHELGWHGLGIGRTPSNPCACNSPECLLLNPIQNRKFLPADNVPSKLRGVKPRTMASRSFAIKDKSDSAKSDASVPEDDEDETYTPAKSVEVNPSDFRTSPTKSQDSDNTSDDLRKIMASCADSKGELSESPKSIGSPEEKISKPVTPKDVAGPSTSRRTRRVYTRRNRVNKKLVLENTSHTEVKPSAAVESADESFNEPIVQKDPKKMTREERKIAQIMKVFDRLEKDKAKRSGAPRGRRQDSESDYTRKDESTEVDRSTRSVRVYRGRGKGRRRLASRDQKQPKKSAAQNLNDQFLTKKATLTKTSTSEIAKSDNEPKSKPNKAASLANTETERPVVPNKKGLRRRKIGVPKKQPVKELQQGQQTEEAAGLLLALSRSTPANPADTSPSNEIESPISNMISVCQLVEAAVAPLETSLKSPKKAILNEWMNKSPESPLAYEISETVPATTYNECGSKSSSPLTLFSLGNEAAQSNRTIPSSKLLDTLVQAASSICDIGTSYPGSNPPKDEDKDTIETNSTITPKVELDEKPDIKSEIKLEQSPMEVSSIVLKDQVVVKKEIQTVIHQVSETIKEISNVTPQPLSSPFVVSSENQVQVQESEEPILETSLQSDTCESTCQNISDSSCIAEVTAKTSAVDAATDLSNDSNVISSYQGNNGGSAKKRWLHQALSEESDHPLSKSSTPLKKRRLVRESASETVNLASDEVNELSGDTKNFQSATTVATSNEETQEPLQSKNSVVAENINLNNADQIENNEKTPVLDAVKNSCSRVLALNSKNAFDWENLENHDETLENNGLINSVNTRTSPSDSLNSLSERVNSEVHEEPIEQAHMSDEIANIHKQLQSFHSENIQVLRSRNQKPKVFEGPRKKVNLMFEVSILEDQTVAVELCNEAKPNRPSSPIKETADPGINTTQIISYDFDEFSRQESILMNQDAELVNTNRVESHDMYMLDNELSTSSLPNYSSLSMLESNNYDLREPQSQDDMCVNTLKYNNDKHISLLSFKDSNLSLNSSATNSLLNKHEIGVAARARLDSILNATDISQDVMFDQVLKNSSHIPNHITSVGRNESPTSTPVPTIQTGLVKPIARTSSSDPRLQQIAPIKKKLSLTEYRARKKTDTNGNGSDIYSSTDKNLGQINVVISDVDEEPNDQENLTFTPEPTLVERELEKHPGFLSQNFFTVPSSITNESETEGSCSDP